MHRYTMHRYTMHRYTMHRYTMHRYTMHHETARFTSRFRLYGFTAAPAQNAYEHLLESQVNMVNPSLPRHSILSSWACSVGAALPRTRRIAPGNFQRAPVQRCHAACNLAAWPGAERTTILVRCALPRPHRRRYMPRGLATAAFCIIARAAQRSLRAAQAMQPVTGNAHDERPRCKTTQHPRCNTRLADAAAVPFQRSTMTSNRCLGRTVGRTCPCSFRL
jgi:hypothetical protein